LFERASTFYYDYGLLMSGKIDQLSTIQNPVLGFSSLGLAVSGNHRIWYKAQLDLNTPAIRDSRAQELGGAAAQLTLGGDVLFDSFRIEIGVAEDLIIDASPDVVFHFGISNR